MQYYLIYVSTASVSLHYLRPFKSNYYISNTFFIGACLLRIKLPISLHLIGLQIGDTSLPEPMMNQLADAYARQKKSNQLSNPYFFIFSFWSTLHTCMFTEYHEMYTSSMHEDHEDGALKICHCY